VGGIGWDRESVRSRLLLLNISDLEKVVIGHLLLPRRTFMGVLDFGVTKLLGLSNRVGLE